MIILVSILGFQKVIASTGQALLLFMMPQLIKSKTTYFVLYVLPNMRYRIDGTYFIGLTILVLGKRYNVTKSHIFFMHSITVKC